MAFLGPEIDRHLADKKVYRVDLSETPALVQDVGARGKLIEGGAGGGGKLAGVHGFLDFGIHAGVEPRKRFGPVQELFRTVARRVPVDPPRGFAV